MTINFSVKDELRQAESISDDAHFLLREVAEQLGQAIRKLKSGKFGAADAKTVGPLVRDLKQAFFWTLEEGNKVEKLRKDVSGVVGTRSLDFQSARDEIGRRLACLRDAGTGG